MDQAEKVVRENLERVSTHVPWTFPEDTVDKMALFKAGLAEFAAMTMFVFVGCGSVAATGEFLVGDVHQTASVARVMPISMAFGFAIVVLAFQTSQVSGGHINPAVTLALFIQKKVSWRRMFVYWFAQYSGAVAGALLLWAGLNQASFTASAGVTQPPPGGVVPSVERPPFRLGANQLNPVLTVWNGLVLEIVGTSLLVGTVLTTAVDARALTGVNSLAPLPIGFSVMVAHLCLVPWTGCGINPARTFGPALVNSLGGIDTWQNYWWIYYIGPGIGAIVTSLAVWFLWGGVRPPNAPDANGHRVEDQDMEDGGVDMQDGEEEGEHEETV